MFTNTAVASAILFIYLIYYATNAAT